jgi:hypothetical protein
MAESIIVHFRNATANEILSFIASRCEKAADRSMYFFPNNASYLLILSAYSDYDIEYDSADKEAIESSLQCRPSFSMDVELRRSQQNAACHAAKKIVSELCGIHELVVDDGHRIWNRAQIATDDDFLVIYRHEHTA